MAPRKPPAFLFRAERGQASLLLLGILAALLAGTLILFGFGQALGLRGKHQRAADLAAVSAAQVVSRHYQRLFEPATQRQERQTPATRLPPSRSASQGPIAHGQAKTQTAAT